MVRGTEAESQTAFTLVELAVVLIILGVLAAFAVPRFVSGLERSKAAEAFKYLAAVQAAQERHHAREGTYAADIGSLGLDVGSLENFETTGIDRADSEALKTRWSQTLTRKAGSSGYGAYTVVFTQDGYDGQHSSISNYPEINPMRAGD